METIKRDPADVPALYILDPIQHKDWIDDILKQKTESEYSLLEEVLKEYFERKGIDAQFLIDKKVQIKAVTHFSNPLGCFNYFVFHDGQLIYQVSWEKGDNDHHYILKAHKK